MKNKYLRAKNNNGIDEGDIEQAIIKYLDQVGSVKNILILPPDISRLNSYAGTIVRLLYKHFKDSKVDIMPALGTHTPMTKAEEEKMYGDIPEDCFIQHNWREDTIKVGEVPAEYVAEISKGYMRTKIDVEVNKRLLDSKYDLIISVGQVVPHEIAGFANYTKNILVGCGGRNMISKSHYLGALYGMEAIMGRGDTPVRRLYNYGANQFLSNIPLIYILTVTTVEASRLKVEALSIGKGDELFDITAWVSQEKNLSFLDRPIKKAVVYLDPEEFKTTWICNKAIYRTRMAIADGGELIIIAPALHGCGEDLENDRLIKKYGYIGRDRVLKATEENEDLKNNLSVAAHLIHGSSEGRFKITYAPGIMTKEEILSLGYDYMGLKEALDLYDIGSLKDGFNEVKGEEIFYISNPALGLWTTRDRFDRKSEGS